MISLIIEKIMFTNGIYYHHVKYLQILKSMIYNFCITYVYSNTYGFRVTWEKTRIFELDIFHPCFIVLIVINWNFLYTKYFSKISFINSISIFTYHLFFGKIIKISNNRKEKRMKKLGCIKVKYANFQPIEFQLRLRPI